MTETSTLIQESTGTRPQWWLARLGMAIIGLGALLSVGAATSASAAGATHSRATQVCVTQEMAITGFSIFRVCMTSDDSYNGSTATGYVSSVSCNVDLPWGAGYSCGTWPAGYTKGSYRYSSGVWEDWVNYRVIFVNPDAELWDTPLGKFQDCVYLRVDTKPSGATTYQHFANTGLQLGTSC